MHIDDYRLAASITNQRSLQPHQGVLYEVRLEPLMVCPNNVCSSIDLPIEQQIEPVNHSNVETEGTQCDFQRILFLGLLAICLPFYCLFIVCGKVLTSVVCTIYGCFDSSIM